MLKVMSPGFKFINKPINYGTVISVLSIISGSCPSELYNLSWLSGGITLQGFLTSALD